MRAPEPQAPEVSDAVALRRSFATFATGVVVVTVGGGAPHGMTANSFSSVSLDPPLVLVCVERTAHMHASLGRSAYFGVSVLAADQEPLARHFADRRRDRGSAQFSRLGWAPGRLTGVPLLDGALATFECQVGELLPGGDHTIFTGELLAVRRGGTGEPLIFHDGRFHRLSPVIA